MKRIVCFRNCSMAAAMSVLVAIGLLAMGAAKEAQSQGTPSAESIIVNGSHWAKASAKERRAFLIGAANMIVAELAYAKRNELNPPPVSDRIVKAVTDLTFEDIENLITLWYDEHPQEQSMPVMGIIWKEIVKKHESM